MENPYASPIANPYGNSQALSTDAVSPGIIAQLAGTKPWVRFMSVLLWIAGGFMLLYIVGILIFAAVMAGTGKSELQGVAGFIGIGAVIYGFFTFMVIYPAIKLWKYGTKIGNAVASLSQSDVVEALAEQRRYWKFQGILVIAGFCLCLIAVIFMAVMSAQMVEVFKQLENMPK